jgi:hypothetical protein
MLDHVQAEPGSEVQEEQILEAFGGPQESSWHSVVYKSQVARRLTFLFLSARQTLVHPTNIPCLFF